jgi:hypothetical protein
MGSSSAARHDSVRLVSRTNPWVALALAATLVGSGDALADGKKDKKKDDFLDTTTELTKTAGAMVLSDTSQRPGFHAMVGGQGFWAAGKVMPGIRAWAGWEYIGVDAEASLIFLSKEAPDHKGLLGSQLGLYVSARPLWKSRVEVLAGAGMDFYPLFMIHGDLIERALSLKLDAHFWVIPSLAIGGGARVYPVASDGLELGTTREYEKGLPVMFTTGFLWRGL